MPLARKALHRVRQLDPQKRVVNKSVFAGPGKPWRHEIAGSKAIAGNSSSTAWWHDVPRGTMDEVSSYVRLDPPFFNGKAD